MPLSANKRVKFISKREYIVAILASFKPKCY